MSWNDVSLDSITLYLKRGISPKYVEGIGIPIVNQKCIRNNTVNFYLARKTSKEKKIQDEKFLRVGDTLVNSTGTGTLGRTGWVKDLNEPSTVDTHVTIVRPNPDRINSKFLSLQLASKEVVIESMGKGATNQIELSAKDLGNLRIELPPLETQKTIANILSAHDDLIENNLKQIKLLEEAAQNIYKEWFVNLRFPNNENTLIDEETGLPEGWGNKKLIDLYNTSSGGTPSRKNPEFYEGDIKWFKTKELKDSLLIDSEEHISSLAIQKSSAKLFPKNTVLMAMYGATIGRLGILTEDATTNQACCAIIPIKEEFSHHFIYNWLLYNREHILSFRMGAAQENISQTVIKDLEILVPQIEVLESFNKIMESNNQLVLNLQLQNQRLKEARDILLPRLMNRTIEV